jgi:site-specific recombinase XerD
MELLDQFKSYLLQGKDTPSKVTVKNYVADVRKFVKWFENRFLRAFSPRLVTKEVVAEFKNQLSSHNSQSQIVSASSLKRYLSSLRKFYQFLSERQMVDTNPFEINLPEVQQPIDAWHLKEFKNFLFLSHASKPTIKNYLVDIKQFITWFEQVTAHLNTSGGAVNGFERIDEAIMEEYKSRLLYDAKFEARSVNRKLSSLRKYFSWVQSQGLIAQPLTFTQAHLASIPAETNMTETPELSLRSLQEQTEPNEDNPVSTYSSFGPRRFMQKLGKGGSQLLDLLFLWPVVNALTAIKYQIWKKSGAEVFAPLEAMVTMAPVPLAARPILEATSTLDTFVTNTHKAGFGNVSNLPKSLYAPVQLSTREFPIHKKIAHHLRHTRPAWYKKYHSYAFVHYLHFGVALIYASALGFMIYQAIVESPRFQAPVLASLPASPPRMLAFEGTLSDASNTPITAEQTLRFGLYDSQTASGSAMLWQETQNVQPDTNGNFRTLLGKTQPIYQSLLNNNPTLYLGISIGPEAELAPRQQIATVTYSQDAERVQGLAPITQTDAGTENVILALDSSGDLIVGGSASPRFEATGGAFTLSGQTLTLTTTEGSNSNVQIVPDGSGIVDIQKPIQNTTEYINAPGVVGAVEIDDSVAIIATTSGQSALYINQNSTGDLISANSSQIARFTVDYAGNGMFGSDLAVNGNNLTTDSPIFNLLNKNVINLNIGGGATHVAIGSASGQTTIFNKLVANNGVTLPSGKDLILEGFSKGAIPFLGSNQQIAQDSDNFFWAQDTKRLGLGTNAPLYRLDVRDNQSNNSVAQIYNTDTGAEADGLIVKLGNTSPTVPSGNRFISFETAGAGVVGSIKGNGLNGIQIVQSSPGDWAEYMKKDISEAIPYGSVVCLEKNGNVTACGQSDTPIGITSEHPTIIAGNDLGDATVPVGILGFVKTRVTSLNGIIKPGDMISASSQKGRGVKAISAGTIIGRALETYENTDPTATGTIMVAVQVGWYQPNIAINQTGDVLTQQVNTPTPGLFDGIIDTIKLGVIEAQSISLQSLSVATENVSIGGVLLRDYVTTIAQETSRDLENQFFTRKLTSPIAEIAQVKTNVISPLAEDANIALQLDESAITVVSSNSAVARIDNEGNASFSGTLRARRIIADEIEGLNIQAASIAASYITNVTNIYNYASNSAEVQNSEATQLSQQTQPLEPSEFLESNELAATFPETSLNTEFAKFNHGLIALGGSSFTDVGISGTLRVGNTMRISDTSINTIGAELALQPLRQGNLSLMGGLVMIDTEGNATFNKDVTVHGKFAANVIVPVPDQDLLMQLPTSESGRASKFEIQTATGSAALTVNQYGDIVASGSGNFANIAAKAFTIVRGVQADTSLTRTVAEGSGGTAIIVANERERTIVTPYIKPTSLIYVTPTSQTYGVTPYIARQTEDSFTIQIPSSVTKDIKLNWWIVN